MGIDKVGIDKVRIDKVGRYPLALTYTLATGIFVIYSHEWERVHKREPAVNGYIVSAFLSLGLGFHSVTPTISFCYSPHTLQPA